MTLNGVILRSIMIEMQTAQKKNRNVKEHGSIAVATASNCLAHKFGIHEVQETKTASK